MTHYYQSHWPFKQKMIQSYQSAELSAGPHWEKRRLIRTLVLSLWRKSSYHYKVLLHRKKQARIKILVSDHKYFQPSTSQRIDFFISIFLHKQTNKQKMYRLQNVAVKVWSPVVQTLTKLIQNKQKLLKAFYSQTQEYFDNILVLGFSTRLIQFLKLHGWGVLDQQKFKPCLLLTLKCWLPFEHLGPNCHWG